MDLIHPAVSEHHLRVAYSCACIAEEMTLTGPDVQSVLVAGALHDVAAACAPQGRPVLDRALECDTFEAADGDVHDHGEDGFRLFSRFEPFARAAAFIRFHHVDWNHGEGRHFRGHAVPVESHMLRLADRVATFGGSWTFSSKASSQINSYSNLLSAAASCTACDRANSSAAAKPTFCRTDGLKSSQMRRTSCEIDSISVRNAAGSTAFPFPAAPVAET